MATLYCLENLGRQTKQKFELNLNKWEDVYQQFDFEYVRQTHGYCPALIDVVKAKSSMPPCKNYLIHSSLAAAQHLVDRHFVSLLTCYFRDEYGYNAAESYPLNPIIKTYDKTGVLVQFDGRTIKRQGRDVCKNTKRNIIEFHANGREWACIGGYDTSFYFGDDVKYLRLSIGEIIAELQRCELFVGCDSGMSHVAGALGVPSAIYIMGECFECLRQYYNCYHNCKIYRPRAKMI